MDGSFANYRNHFLLAAAVCAIGAVFGSPVAGAVAASMYFWGKEIGEKCVQRPAPRLPWSDMNPFDARWSTDNRLDLVSALIGAWAFVPFYL